VKSSSREANIIGFNVLINCEGVVVTEMSGIPSEELSTVFKDAELSTMRNIVQLTKQKLEPIHAYLEAELSALNHQEP
jgi:hypothetical protein